MIGLACCAYQDRLGDKVATTKNKGLNNFKAVQLVQTN